MSLLRPADVATQCAAAVLMVRPACFGFNPQTAASNRFQRHHAAEGGSQQALAQFSALAGALTAAGVRVCIAEDTNDPPKPDAVFPNNWVSFHRDGTVVLYPMQAPNRRPERRLDVLELVGSELGFRCRHLLDLSAEEQHDRFLEGTGSLVLDRANRIAYACRSPRTDPALVRVWADAMGYEAELFDATGADGAAVYHTNVLLSVGARVVVICSEAIATADRGRVRERLQGSGRRLVEITRAAMQSFAGNVLELRTEGGDGARTVLVMSERARFALEPPQWEELRDGVGQVLSVALPTIEDLGGGGARCMLAEVPEVPA